MFWVTEVEGNLVPRANSSTIFKMADRMNAREYWYERYGTSEPDDPRKCQRSVPKSRETSRNRHVTLLKDLYQVDPRRFSRFSRWKSP